MDGRGIGPRGLEGRHLAGRDQGAWRQQSRKCDGVFNVQRVRFSAAELLKFR